jgi:hypothetical protein
MGSGAGDAWLIENINVGDCTTVTNVYRYDQDSDAFVVAYDPLKSSAGLFEFDDVWALAPDDVWFGGANLAHWNGRELEPRGSLYELDLASNIGHFTGSSTTDVWAGSRGAAIRWDGKSWARIPAPESTAIVRLWRFGDHTLAVGDGGQVFTY